MRHALTLHPESQCHTISSIEVEVERPRPAALVLRYFVTGTMSGIRWPATAPPKRTDGLWRHTCFEAFVQDPAERAYAEFNFSPSTQWAAYWFNGYRDGMTIAREMGPPRIEREAEAQTYNLQTLLTLTPLAHLRSDVIWRLGLSAVIEDTSGRLSYWALAHPTAKPDFHHPDCFTLEVAAASRT